MWKPAEAIARLPSAVPVTQKEHAVTSALYFAATLGELTGLALWLHYIDGHHFWIANAWLLAGFAVERASVAIWLRKFQLPEAVAKPLWKTIMALAFATAIEMTIWHVWRASAAYWNVVIAGFLLFLMIHPLHAGEMAGVRQQPWIKFVIRRPTLLFSFVEAAGGTAWLALWHAGTQVARIAGIAALGVALFIEHHHQGMELEDKGFRV